MDEEFNNQLAAVASTLAYHRVTEQRKARDSNPEYFDEGWDFCAAENMLTGEEYFKVKVWEEESRIMEELLALPLPNQRVLVAWNELPPSVRVQPIIVIGPHSHHEINDRDEIPF